MFSFLAAVLFLFLSSCPVNAFLAIRVPFLSPETSQGHTALDAAPRADEWSQLRSSSSPNVPNLDSFYAQKCSDTWHCDPTGCWIIVNSDSFDRCVESKINTGTTYGDHYGECAVTGSVSFDVSKIKPILDNSPVEWSPAECLIVYNDENDPDDFSVVCNLSGDDLKEWKAKLVESEKVMFEG
mmetsp:Transcript_1535/g.2695  ORF Transcript_1535/g.2695 Transcript_1535/m.2695 type:complete len:183 (-) Transcript_1535:46-594(-)|eukprot:CAMPEP_0182507584 /NCGR_PEP_ID=MMETSP1321-20130603/23402_1 /TAXON_ID=91990 /ORGANISM="Bolidomonas sp., Strain RCC1657" /LENGTH=182 /DNA_ID=CAMNT_0024713505 /DNA_START=605 /DNA_END=1153 /DNA_ORIENTATION=-